jgi:hypothetical protein
VIRAYSRPHFRRAVSPVLPSITYEYCVHTGFPGGTRDVTPAVPHKLVSACQDVPTTICIRPKPCFLTLRARDITSVHGA